MTPKPLLKNLLLAAACAACATDPAAASPVWEATTADGGAAGDITLNSNGTVENGSNELRVRWGLGGTGRTGVDRITLLRFDLSGIPEAMIDRAELRLGVAEGDGIEEIRVWGLNEGADGDGRPGGSSDAGWDEATVTFANAPGRPIDRDDRGPTLFRDADALLPLGVARFSSAAPVWTFSSAPLRNLLEKDRNGLVTLVLTRNSQGRGSSEFFSAEQILADPGRGIAPTLKLMLLPTRSTVKLSSAGSASGFGDVEPE